jgi:hypothetical protein
MRNKMTATMKTMELIHADNLKPDQLMEEDLIEIEDGIVEVVSINSDATGDNYFIEYQNEFGERDVVTLSVDETIKLFVFIEDEVDE